MALTCKGGRLEAELIDEIRRRQLFFYEGISILK